MTRGSCEGIHCGVKLKSFLSSCAALILVGGIAAAQEGAAAPPPPNEAEVLGEVVAETIPPEVLASAVSAVAKLGEEVVLGRYQVAVERMNPRWKARAAQRMGGMAALEKQLDGVAAQMVQQGISMISSKPQGQPRPYEVTPAKRIIKQNGVDTEIMAYNQWMVLVPTVTKFRILRPGIPKPLVIESTGFQVAICNKGKNDWTFIDGSGLSTNDLRSLFNTLPQNMELPPIVKREVR